MFIENLQGFSATLSGNWLNNTILGGAVSTDESLSGELGNDFLCGVEGVAGSGRVTFGGRDTLTGGLGSDIFSLMGTDDNSLYLNDAPLNWNDINTAIDNFGIVGQIGTQAALIGSDQGYAVITDFGDGESITALQRASEASLPDFDSDADTIVRYRTQSLDYSNGSINISNATYLYAVDGIEADLIAIY
jgi:hypothetical protein